jgi:hypothetical protein
MKIVSLGLEDHSLRSHSALKRLVPKSGVLLVVRFPSALRAPRYHDGCPALRRAVDSIMHRRPPQRPSLGAGLFCPGPSSLNRPHPPHSQAHRDFTAWRLIRDAFAVRERRGDPRVVPGFHRFGHGSETSLSARAVIRCNAKERRSFRHLRRTVMPSRQPDGSSAIGSLGPMLDIKKAAHVRLR